MAEKKMSADEAKALAKEKAKEAMKKNRKFLDEFKEFINRGSVLDLAVGVVVGGAFSKIVTSLVDNILMPVIGMIIGGVDFTGLSVTVPNWLGGEDAAVLHYGQFIQDVIDFLIVAWCIFLVVKMFNKIQERNKKKEETEPVKVEKSNEEKMVELLEDIKKEVSKKK